MAGLTIAEQILRDYEHSGATDRALGNPPRPPLPTERCEAYWRGWRAADAKPAQKRLLV